MADGFELLLGVAIEDIGAEAGAVVRVGIPGHFGVWNEAGGIEHPLVVVAGAETVVGESEVDALDFEGGEGEFVIDGVAGDAGVAGHSNEVLADFDLVCRRFFFRRFRGRKAVVLTEAVGHVFGVEWEGGHAHVEPWTRAWFDFSEKGGFDVVCVEHRAHVGERRAGLDEAFVGFSDVVEEGFGLGVGFRKERGLAVVVVAGGATEGSDLAVGVGFDRVVLQGRQDSRGDHFFLFDGQVEAGRFPAFFIGAEAALGGPIFQAIDIGCLHGGWVESFVTGRAVEGTNE